MDTIYPMELTQMESLYLSDSLSMFTQNAPDALPGQVSVFPDMLMKIGGAVLETERQKGPVTVNVTLNELWIVREVAKSSVVIGSERVGLSLLRKVYEGIRELAAESEVQDVVNTFGQVLQNEPGKREYVAQLKRIQSGGSVDHKGAPPGDTRPHNQGGVSDDDSGKDNKQQPGNSDENRPCDDAEAAS